MNCNNAKQQITDTLAAGQAELGPEITIHLQACEGCRAFYVQQAKLFRAIGSGLHAMANEPVPPSLLPGIRVQLGDQSVIRRAWIPRWGLAVVAAAIILTVSVGYVKRRPVRNPSVFEKSPVVSQSVRNADSAIQPLLSRTSTLPKRMHKQGGLPTASAAVPETSPEVIVLAEEREAFARFVARLPEEREVALALTRPASARADVPVEIALLQIESLALRPLEGTPSE